MKKIRTGIENFKEMIDSDAYYVDKTNLIKDTIDRKVVLYTRPRRFGKTLNMSMLYYFYSIEEKENAYLFNHLKVSNDLEVLKYQNQYPVVSISLKGLDGDCFEEQKNKFLILIQEFFYNHNELLESPKLNKVMKDKLLRLYEGDVNLSELENSLAFITHCMKMHYSRKVIVLIDEYDVPLQKAYIKGYYDEMSTFISSLFHDLLKTNDSLEKGILTGCLRIARESIFTGLNNFDVLGITDYNASDCFGFTQDELDEMLEYYSLLEKRDLIKEWYDGYSFGDSEIYNSWSVTKYLKDLLSNNNNMPISYWANSSGNDIVRKYIKEGNINLRDELRILVEGNSLIKDVKPELTYKEMDDLNNIYSFLLYTGYLKIRDRVYDQHHQQIKNRYELVIPNKEVKEIYEHTFMEWYNEYKSEYSNQLINDLLNKEPQNAESIVNDLLSKDISYHDYDEKFYHGLLVGLLHNDYYSIKSNRESGLGRSDLVLKCSDLNKPAIIIECKYTKDLSHLREVAKKGLKQIEEKEYIQELKNEQYRNVICYSMAFSKKTCIILLLEND